MTVETIYYRYLFTDLVKTSPTWNPTVLGELQLTNVTWGHQLNAAGQMSGQININDSRLKGVLGSYNSNYRSGLEFITSPWRCAVYVERNGEIVWGGPIISREWDSESQVLTINGATFDAYFDRRLARDYLGGEGLLIFDEGTDQFMVMAGVGGILDNMDSEPNGDLGIGYDSSELSGAVLSGVYTVYDYEHKKVSQVLSDMFQRSTAYDDNNVAYQLGFDWWVDCFYDSTSNIQRLFTMYYPSKGNQDTTSPLLPVLEFPGSIISYRWPEDGSSMTTSLTGLGPGSAEGQYSFEAVPSATLFPDIGNYPLLQDVTTFTQIPDIDAVDSLTQAQADVRGEPVVAPQFTWSPAANQVRDVGSAVSNGPGIGEFGVGDLFSIRLNDARFYGGVEKFLRLTKFDVSVGDSGAEIVVGDFSVKGY